MKKIGLFLLAVVLIIIFVEPIRNYLNSFLHKDKTELEEEEMLGILTGYNPRIEEIQRILVSSGFLPEQIDGKMGKQTRDAIKEFQKAKGLKPTSRVDSKTWTELSRQKLQKESEIKEAQKTEAFLKWQEPIPKSKNRRKQIQGALKNAGFYEGDMDGKLGIQTKRAITAFQKAKGLKPDGVVGPKTWQELSKYLKD